MKAHISILIFSLLVLSAHAEQTDKTFSGYSDLGGENDFFLLIQATDEYKALEAACQGQNDDQEACILKGLSREFENNSSFADKVQDMVAAKKQSEGLDLQRSEDNSLVTKDKTPKHIRELGEYLYMRLDESLRGDGKKRKVTDHMVFYELYKNQLGRNAVDALSFYCIEADPEGIWKEEEAEKNRKANLKSLKDISGTGKNTAFSQFSKCAQNIKFIAYGLKRCKCSTENCEENKSSDPARTCPAGLEKDFADETDETKNKALIVVSQMQKMRDTMARIDRIEEQYNDLKKRSPGSIDFQAGELGLDEYNSGANEGEKSIDELTSLTSQEYFDAAGSGGTSVGDHLQADKELFEKCQQSKSLDDCQQFGLNKEEFDESMKAYKEQMAEVALFKAQLKKMEKDELQEKLKLKGLSDEQIDAMLEEETDIEKIKDKYEEELERKRLAILDQQKKLLEKRELVVGDNNMVVDVDKLAEDVESRSTDYAELLQYSNIILGYFSVEGEGVDPDKTGQGVIENSAVVRRELENSYNDPNKRGPANIEDKALFEQLQTALEQHLPSDDSGDPLVDKKVRTLDTDKITDLSDFTH